MIEVPGAKILVRVVCQGLTYRGVVYPKGATMEVTHDIFERMRAQNAVEAVEVAIAGSPNIDMEAARARVAQEQEQQQRAGGRSSSPLRRYGRNRRG